MEKLDFEIYELRKKGHSYNEIVGLIYKKTGKQISLSNVYNRYKGMAKEFGEIEVKIEPKKKIYIPDNILIALMNKGCTYREISNYLQKNNIEVDYDTMRRRCHQIIKKYYINYVPKKYKEEKIDIDIEIEKPIVVEPTIEKPIAKKPSENQLNNTILDLKARGYTDLEILNYFKKRGMSVNIGVIYQKAKELKEFEKKERDAVLDKKLMDKARREALEER